MVSIPRGRRGESKYPAPCSTSSAVKSLLSTEKLKFPLKRIVSKFQGDALNIMRFNTEFVDRINRCKDKRLSLISKYPVLIPPNHTEMPKDGTGYNFGPCVAGESGGK